jgi:hypothetical protein
MLWCISYKAHTTNFKQNIAAFILDGDSCLFVFTLLLGLALQAKLENMALIMSLRIEVQH